MGVLTRPIDNLKVCEVTSYSRQPRLTGGRLTGKDNSTITVLSELVTQQVSMETIMGWDVVSTIVNQKVSKGLGKPGNTMIY